MEQKEYKIEGFRFKNQSDYDKAKQEFDNVTYIKAHTDFSDTKKMMKLYLKLIEKDTFKTVIGLTFLADLRKQLQKSVIVSKEYLESIPVDAFLKKSDSDELEEIKNANLLKYKNMAEKTQSKLRNSRIMLLFLCIIVIIMFIMAIFYDKTAFRNYKEQVTDEYATWDESLKVKEASLNEREEQLKEYEIQLEVLKKSLSEN